MLGCHQNAFASLTEVNRQQVSPSAEFAGPRERSGAGAGNRHPALCSDRRRIAPRDPLGSRERLVIGGDPISSTGFRLIKEYRSQTGGPEAEAYGLQQRYGRFSRLVRRR